MFIQQHLPQAQSCEHTTYLEDKQTLAGPKNAICAPK